MSRTMPHNAWLFFVVLFSFASAGPVHAATETVTLKNGKTYEVEIDRRGEPVGAENRQVEITFLGAFSHVSPSADSPAYVWTWNARLKKKGAFKVTVTTPIDKTVSASFDVAGRGEIGTKFFFDSEEYSTLWAWLDEPETSWIPFVFTFKDSRSDNTFALTQWARFDTSDKGAFVELAYLTAGLTFPEQNSVSSADLTQNDLQESAELQEAVAAVGPKARSELLAEPTQSASDNDAALLYIFREDNMRLSGKRDVYMDETPIALLPRLSYTTAITEPGWHLMWGDVRSEWFEFQGGRTYLLRILARQTGDDQWLLDDAERIQQGISVFNLQHVVLTEESLAKLRKKLHKYARARKRAGDRPESVYSAELTGIHYKNKPPGFSGLFGGFGAGGTLKLTEAAISYQAKKHELEIPMSDVLSVGLHGGGLSEAWIAIMYREQDTIQTAYFGAIHSFGAYNRMMLAFQHSLGIARAEETSSPNETFTPPFDGRDWELGYRSVQGDQIVLEYVLSGETVENWTELITVMSFIGAQESMSPEDYIPLMKESLFEDCPTAMWNIISQSDSDVIVESRTEGCVGPVDSDDQYEIARIVTGSGAIHIVSYVTKRQPHLPDIKRSEWIDRISQGEPTISR